MIQADEVALDSLLAAGCAYTHSNGLFQSKKEVIEMLTSGNVRYLSIEASDVWMRCRGWTCVITGNQTVKLEVRGEPVTSISRYTVVWAELGERWQCIAYQSTPIPQNEGD